MRDTTELGLLFVAFLANNLRLYTKHRLKASQFVIESRMYILLGEDIASTILIIAVWFSTLITTPLSYG